MRVDKMCVCVCVCMHAHAGTHTHTHTYMHKYSFAFSFSKCILSANHVSGAVLCAGDQGAYALVLNLNTWMPCMM